MGEVRIEERGEGVVLATLSNPPHALMDEMIVDDLEALVNRAEQDADLTGIVLTGAHPERFVAHYDIEALGLREARGGGARERAASAGEPPHRADGRERAEFMSAIGSADADAAMAAYVDEPRRTGELSLYSAEALGRALDAGRFG